MQPIEGLSRAADARSHLNPDSKRTQVWAAHGAHSVTAAIRHVGHSNSDADVPEHGKPRFTVVLQVCFF